MMQKQPTIVQLEDCVLSWAKNEPDIRAILVVGSLARIDHPGDEWADLDLMIFADRATPYFDDQSWLTEIGDAWVVIPHQIGPDEPELLVLFEGGYKVDFAFLSVEGLRRIASSKSMSGVIHRGYYVILDKDGVADQLPRPSFAPPPFTMPTESKFMGSVNTFWYGAVYVAKQIHRRDLWIVKYRDWTLKQFLLEMMEWHARATHGQSYDTWHDGRFLLEWVDEKTRKQLHGVFGRFNAADSWHSLLATMELFRRLSIEAAAQWQYPYPTKLDERATQFVKTLFDEDSSE